MITSGYLPGTSLLHSFDPRLKAALMLALAVSFFLPVSLPILSIYLSLCVLIVLVYLGVRELWIPIRMILPLLILVTILTPPFHPSGETLFTLWGPITVTLGGIKETLRLLIRFSGITLSFFLFFRSTDIETLILTLRWYRLPYSMALVLTIAFRYIPYVASLYHAVSDAHRLRRPSSSGKGRRTPAGSHRGRLRKRIHHVFPILVSVMIHSVKTIPSLAMALESRGFGRQEKRSALYSLPPLFKRTKDLSIFIFLILLILLPLFTIFTIG